MKTNKKYFTQKQMVILTEIYRRLNYLNEGNLDKICLYLGYPSQVKVLSKFNILKPSFGETARVVNWYCLTDKGKKFFSNYLETISNENNLIYFEGRDYKYFDIELLNE